MTRETAAKLMMIGNVGDKSFHLPECQCDDCETWRVRSGYPTYAAILNWLNDNGPEPEWGKWA